VIDLLPVALAYAAMLLVLNATSSPAIMLVATIGTAVVIAAFALYQWWAYATRGAGIGAWFTGLRLVSLKDGEPVGWWRFFLRQLVFSALMGTVVGGVALLIFLVVHERRQGWHDMVAGAVVVQPKVVEAKQQPPQKKTPTTSTVGLPPHLASTFSPQPGTSSAWAPEPQAAPDWLPGVASEPLPPQNPFQPAPAQPGASQQAPWSPPQGGPGTQQWPAPAPQPWQPPGQPSQPLPVDAQQPGGAQPWVPGQRWQEPEPPAAQPMPSPARSPQAWIPIPSASSVIEPSRSVRVRERVFGEVDDDEGTRIASLPPAAAQRDGDEGWYVRLDDGREVELSVTVLLGRNPHKTEGDPQEVHLVPASGDGRMISRTHVLIGTDPRGVFVVDRGSTNGTALVAAGGSLEPCPPGTQMRVREGQQVSYGNRWVTVLRRPAPPGR